MPKKTTLALLGDVYDYLFNADQRINAACLSLEQLFNFND
jgi:hypothetical protein